MQSQAGDGPSANGQELEDVPWASSPLPILPVGKQEIAFFLQWLLGYVHPWV